VIAICPASFDPVTYGHLDIIERAAKIFERVLVVAAINPRKNALFSPIERVEMLREATAHLPNVEVDFSEGLLAVYARRRGASVIVKGLRAFSDFEVEFQMAQMNKRLDGGIETVFMMTTTRFSYLSSSVIKEVAQFGGSLEGLVPAFVEARLKARLGRE
jgi:pantetheine-phosphate adenylyltransferase